MFFWEVLLLLMVLFYIDMGELSSLKVVIKSGSRSYVEIRLFSINFTDFAGYLRDFLFSLLMSSQKQSKLIKGTNLILLCAFSMRIRWCLYLIPAR